MEQEEFNDWFVEEFLKDSSFDSIDELLGFHSDRVEDIARSLEAVSLVNVFNGAVLMNIKLTGFNVSTGVQG